MLEGKKTLIGLVLGGATQVINEVAKMFDDDPLTNIDYKVVVAAVILIYGALDRLRRGGSVAATEVIKTDDIPGNPPDKE